MCVYTYMYMFNGAERFMKPLNEASQVQRHSPKGPSQTLLTTQIVGQESTAKDFPPLKLLTVSTLWVFHHGAKGSLR